MGRGGGGEGSASIPESGRARARDATVRGAHSKRVSSSASAASAPAWPPNMGAMRARSSAGAPCADLSWTNSPMRSATSGSRPLSSTISRRTSAHGSLSSLSTAEQIVRNLSGGQPHRSKIESSRRRWLSLMQKLPIGRSVRISAHTVTASASATMSGNVPAMSKSHW